jgi:hypothetical protein
LENICSDGTDVAGIQKYFFTTLTTGSITPSLWLFFHYWSGLTLSKRGQSLYSLMTRILLTVLFSITTSFLCVCFSYSFFVEISKNWSRAEWSSAGHISEKIFFVESQRPDISQLSIKRILRGRTAFFLIRFLESIIKITSKGKKRYWVLLRDTCFYLGSRYVVCALDGTSSILSKRIFKFSAE